MKQIPIPGNLTASKVGMYQKKHNQWEKIKNDQISEIRKKGHSEQYEISQNESLTGFSRRISNDVSY